uniref:Uncharacterized protein n=1 Tax=Otus sunia TaxID=257818 RepID=A0A8C8A7V0_9STRI
CLVLAAGHSWPCSGIPGLGVQSKGSTGRSRSCTTPCDLQDLGVQKHQSEIRDQEKEMDFLPVWRTGWGSLAPCQSHWSPVRAPKPCLSHWSPVRAPKPCQSYWSPVRAPEPCQSYWSPVRALTPCQSYWCPVRALKSCQSPDALSELLEPCQSPEVLSRGSRCGGGVGPAASARVRGGVGAACAAGWGIGGCRPVRLSGAAAGGEAAGSGGGPGAVRGGLASQGGLG